MKIRDKLIASFVLVSLMVGVVGLVGLYANNQFIYSFEFGEEHYEKIITASVEISSYAKRAEGHVMLFLTINNASDAGKFYQRIESLKNYTDVLDKEVRNSEALEIVADIKKETADLESTGVFLLNAYANETDPAKRYNFTTHASNISDLNKRASKIREDGVDLVEIETRLEIENEEAAKKNASFFFNVILLSSLVLITIIIIMGYFMTKKITDSLAKIGKFASDVGSGKLDDKIDIKADDEIMELANAFNKMTNDLKKSKESLDQSKKDLEDKVAELEKVNKLTVGRELKMAEMKAKMKTIDAEDEKNNDSSKGTDEGSSQ